jgi:carbonic anhydrase/acetyltransferase-like protein (isoleucine patch superfamily)
LPLSAAPIESAGKPRGGRSRFANVTIGDAALIGGDAVICPGADIGRRARIGKQAPIPTNASVPPDATVPGSKRPSFADCAVPAQ